MFTFKCNRPSLEKFIQYGQTQVKEACDQRVKWVKEAILAPRDRVVP